MSTRSNRNRKTAAPVAQNTDEQIVDTNTDAGTVEQSEELQAEIASGDGELTSKSADDYSDAGFPEEADLGLSNPEPAGDEVTNDGDPANEAPAEAPAAEVSAAPVDPFADLPLTKIEDYEFRDLTTAATSNPRKYEGVHKAALEAKLPMKKDWKHASAMVTSGRVKREFRPGSVYGTIEQLVSQYGRAGVPAYVLVTQVRQRQIGNKRSHYCTELPPIGWAEGWIDTFISKGHGKVMEKKAPAITAEVVAEVVAEEAVAEQEAQRQAA